MMTTDLLARQNTYECNGWLDRCAVLFCLNLVLFSYGKRLVSCLEALKVNWKEDAFFLFLSEYKLYLSHILREYPFHYMMCSDVFRWSGWIWVLFVLRRQICCCKSFIYCYNICVCRVWVLFSPGFITYFIVWFWFCDHLDEESFWLLCLLYYNFCVRKFSIVCAQESLSLIAVFGPFFFWWGDRVLPDHIYLLSFF